MPGDNVAVVDDFDVCFDLAGVEVFLCSDEDFFFLVSAAAGLGFWTDPSAEVAAIVSLGSGADSSFRLFLGCPLGFWAFWRLTGRRVS